MRMPLLIDWNPREATTGPRVRLSAGRWRITSHNWIESKLQLIKHSFDDPSVSPLEPHFEFDGPAVVSIGVLLAGGERALTIYAELI